MNLIRTIALLSAETTVSNYLLLEDEELLEMIRNKTDYLQLLNYVEENY